MSSCLKCLKKGNQYSRENSSTFSYNEIFPGHSTGKNEIKLIRKSPTKKLVRCTNCSAVWYIEISEGSPVYADFNRTDPRDTAPDASGPTTVKAKVIKEDQVENFIKNIK